MKKRVLAMILAVLMVAALTACGSDTDRIAELEAENEALKAQVAELTGQLENASYSAGLSDWSFTAVAWSGNNGANVTFTGTPVNYTEGQSAELTIWLEGDLIDSISCDWDGASYTAVTDLNAADGYCYYCTITEANGSQMEVELNTPKKPTDEAIINMETALTSYCGMMVEDSTLEGSNLTLNAGYAQVQLPLIGRTGEDVTCSGAELVLEAEGKEVARCELSLQPGEDGSSYTAEIAGISFTIPAMEDDQQLEIRMEVTLSDGQLLTTAGGSWFYNGGELFLVVG